MFFPLGKLVVVGKLIQVALCNFYSIFSIGFALKIILKVIFTTQKPIAEEKKAKVLRLELDWIL